MEPYKENNSQRRHKSHNIQRFTLIVCVIIFLTIILVISVLYQKYKQVKRSIKQSILKVIPKMTIQRYNEIGYPKEIPKELMTHLHKKSRFNPQVAIFLGKFINSSYNISSGYDPMLPHYAKWITRVGENGDLYQLTNEDGLYVLAYRGTNSKEDLMTDIDFSQVPMEGNIFVSDKDSGVMVHSGFSNLWQKQKEEIFALRYLFAKNANNNIYVTGHSLGAATAAFTALDLSYILPPATTKISLCMFATPRVGNDKFVNALEKVVPNYWSIENKRDMVVNLPPPTFCLFGGSWIYDDYRRIYEIDLETGGVADNHHLDTYLFALGDNQTKGMHVYWNRSAKMVSTLKA